jgi:hypothetical protein
MVETGNRPTCPACGDDTKQQSLGQLWDRPQIVCHCRACEKLYLVDFQPPSGEHLLLMPTEDPEWEEMVREYEQPSGDAPAE